MIKQECHNLSCSHTYNVPLGQVLEVLVGYYLGVAMDKEDTVQDQKVT